MCTLFEAKSKNRAQLHHVNYNSISYKWRLWCRLCAKEDPENNVSILLKHENGEELDDEVGIGNSNLACTIERLFSVEITCDDNLPKMLCTECFSLITTLVNYTERVDKVQQMLCTLQENLESSKAVNLDALRLKYDLLDEDSQQEFIHQPIAEVLYLEMNSNGDECESGNIGNSPMQNSSEELDDDSGDEGTNNLDESLIDLPSSSTRKPQLSKRNNTPKSDQQNYKCPHCSRICKYKSYYDVHVLTHLPEEEKKRCPCPHCGKKFITTFRVTQHIRVAHMDDRPYACDICEKTFKANRYLKQHMETHNPTKHVCPKCGLQLNSSATLNRHLLVHSNARNHKCDYCGLAFKCSKNLKHHLLLHTGLRLYTCNFCNRTFNNATACRVHKKNAHPEEFATLEEKGGGVGGAALPTLEDLKNLAKTSSNSEVVGSKRSRRSRYRLKKFPILENIEINLLKRQ